MNDKAIQAARRWRGKAVGLGLVATGAVAGGVLASTLTASAADTTGTPSPSYSYGMPLNGGGPGHRGPMGGAAPVRSDETQLTGSDAAQAKAAALAAVPGGTVYRVETDAGDGVYEAHMTRADGTPVTVKMDKNFNVTAVEDGMGKGDPAMRGAPPSGTSSGA